MDVKTVHYSLDRYKITRSGVAAGKLPVDRRAGLLQAEYDKALKEADHRWCGVPREAGEEVVGPMRAVFRGRGRLVGLVFGCVAEVSKDVVKLIKVIALAGASNIGMAAGAKTHEQAYRRHLWHVKRSLSGELWRSLAGLLLDRVMDIDVSGGAGRRARATPQDGSSQRRQGAQRQAQQANKAQSRHKTAGRDRGGSYMPHNMD